MMHEHADAGLKVALAYHEAWTSGDFERAMTYVAPDIRCDAPAGSVVGAEAFHEFMGPFTQSVKRTELLAAYGEGDTALLMYDTETIPVPQAPGAELITVADGRIRTMRIIFDRHPFELARQAAGNR